MNFSKYMSSLSKANFDSWRASSHAEESSLASFAILIPLPPPPAVAFNITG